MSIRVEGRELSKLNVNIAYGEGNVILSIDSADDPAFWCHLFFPFFEWVKVVNTFASEFPEQAAKVFREAGWEQRDE